MVNNDDNASGPRISIKFLMPNSYAGSLIGKGGKAIRELIAVSEAKVNVSDPSQLYPGTSDRVILVSGTQDSVSLAQTLIWEMIAQNVKANEEEVQQLEWSPEAVVNSLGTNDNIVVTSKVTIPANAGGIILGKGGDTIRSICQDSGAKLIMTSKDDALFTQERVITISGEAGHCVKSVDLILSKLSEQNEIPMFMNRGTTYSLPGNSYFNSRNSGGGKGRGDRNNGKVEDDNDTIAQTNITISIPNELVGNIFGRQGSTMREIISLSGAKVNVSGRDEFVEGTRNRLVTITGSPASAQAAHLFITQRLETPANNPPRRARS